MKGNEGDPRNKREPNKRRRSGPDLNSAGAYYVPDIHMGPGNRIIIGDNAGMNFGGRPNASAGSAGRRSGNRSRA